ncbi:MAG: hypothetical protein OXC37_03740, partial [Bdellovibrionaceae bacterium]|nr:hypothetical protein [Pseudobdellovibrionaceae bacterium]
QCQKDERYLKEINSFEAEIEKIESLHKKDEFIKALDLLQETWVDATFPGKHSDIYTNLEFLEKLRMQN